MRIGSLLAHLRELETGLAAAVLNTGCLETGSQIVIVSSFAARARPFGPAASSSQ